MLTFSSLNLLHAVLIKWTTTENEAVFGSVFFKYSMQSSLLSQSGLLLKCHSGPVSCMLTFISNVQFSVPVHNDCYSGHLTAIRIRITSLVPEGRNVPLAKKETSQYRDRIRKKDYEWKKGKWICTQNVNLTITFISDIFTYIYRNTNM